MRFIVILIIVLTPLIGISQSFSSFPHWLKGKWEIKSEHGSSYEKWSIKNDGSMVGQTFRVFYEDTIIFDTMRIKSIDNLIVYEMSANIGNNKVYAGYILSMPDSALWKFENIHTDYPKNINYQILAKDSVYVWTEAKDINTACVDFLMIRVSDE